MKIIPNKLCRKRYKVQVKIRKWINRGQWGWDTGRPVKTEKVKSQK